MPVMDGHTAARAIREWENSQASNPAAPRLPIIAMTAHAMTGDAEKSLAAGMNDHVTKPIDPNQLFSALVKWVTPDRGPIEARAAAEAEPVKDEGAAKDLPETLPGFDLAQGLRRLQGNRTLYRKLILQFADSCREGIAQLRTAIESMRHEEILQVAHSIKGSAGNLAAEDVQAAAMALEHLVKDRPDEPPPMEALKPAFEKLEQASAAMFGSVAALGGEPQDAAPEDGDVTAGIPPDDLATLATRIREAAEMGDMTELQAIAAELDQQFGAKQSLSRSIVDLADDFDLDGLGELAKELVAS
nr:Hpt domain-containing protein [Desulfobacterales bacterium]